jgi:hypothetical protein
MGATAEPDEERFSCQATELNKATTPLAWWDVRQYIRELRSNNVGGFEFIRVIAIAAFNLIQRRCHGRPYPCVRGTLTKTPRQVMDLQPGETVQVKTQEEIEATLDTRRKNRGLWFDEEMVQYCEGQFKVSKRVEKIINEKTGKMMRLPNDCIVLEGVTCSGHVSSKRLFCPRSIFPYWREIWLKRISHS